MAHRARAVLVTAALWAGGACKQGPRTAEAFPIGQLVVGDSGFAGQPEIAETPEGVRRELQQVLERTGRFVVREGAPAHLRLRVERAQRVLAPAPGGDRLTEREMAEVVLSLELSTPGSQGEGERLFADGWAQRPTGADDTLDPASRHAAFDAAMDAALSSAVAELRDQVVARRKSEPELISDLSSADPRVRDYAIRVLAERRSPSSVPALVARLDDPDPNLAGRAAGALTAIGDRRAVKPLIELARHRRSDQMGPILYAIGTLGGVEAEAFLFTLESGAPDESVRTAARGAYQDLLRRKQEDASRTAGSHP